MTILMIPLHLPISQTAPMILRETKHRHIVRLFVVRNLLIIDHEPLSHEEKAELLSCIEGPIIVS